LRKTHDGTRHRGVRRSAQLRPICYRFTRVAGEVVSAASVALHVSAGNCRKFIQPFCTDPSTADEQSDRTTYLEDAVDAAFDAAQANPTPEVPKEFSIGIDAPLYDNSNAAGHVALEGNPEIALADR
jgi:sulfite reductase beta subunit-like hemoprotein